LLLGDSALSIAIRKLEVTVHLSKWLDQVLKGLLELCRSFLRPGWAQSCYQFHWNNAVTRQHHQPFHLRHHLPPLNLTLNCQKLLPRTVLRPLPTVLELLTVLVRQAITY